MPEKIRSHIDSAGSNAFVARLLASRSVLSPAPRGVAVRLDRDWARRPGAPSWELHAAASLARLLRNRSRLADALALLDPVYDRFSEGFEMADLKSAKPS